MRRIAWVLPWRCNSVTCDGTCQFVFYKQPLASAFRRFGSFRRRISLAHSLRFVAGRAEHVRTSPAHRQRVNAKTLIMHAIALSPYAHGHDIQSKDRVRFRYDWSGVRRCGPSSRGIAPMEHGVKDHATSMRANECRRCRRARRCPRCGLMHRPRCITTLSVPHLIGAIEPSASPSPSLSRAGISVPGFTSSAWMGRADDNVNVCAERCLIIRSLRRQDKQSQTLRLRLCAVRSSAAPFVQRRQSRG